MTIGYINKETSKPPELNLNLIQKLKVEEEWITFFFPQGRDDEVTPLGVIVSLGTGRIPTVPVRTIDIFKPGGLFDAWKSAQGMSALINILQEQVNTSSVSLVYQDIIMT